MPGSQRQLDAALKMTDALYFFDLEMALRQADTAFQLADKRNDKAAKAVCAIDRALITGWLKGHDASLEHFDMATDLFDECAEPKYRVHFYSSSILYEIFRNSGKSNLSEYFRLNDIASSECKDPHLILQQHMLAAFNRVVLGECSLDAPEIKFSRKKIEELNRQIDLHDANTMLAVLDAWQAQKNDDNDAYIIQIERGLEHARLSHNRLYQMFALGKLVAPRIAAKDWRGATRVFNDCLELAEAHHSPPLKFECHAKLASIKMKLDDYPKAKYHINEAMGLDYFNSRTHKDRHAVYQLAFDLYCFEGDIENIKKFSKLMSAPEHMRAVVETEQRNVQLKSQIAELIQDHRIAKKNYQESNSNLYELYIAEQDRSQAIIRALSAVAIVLAIIGLITALCILRNRLRRVEKRLSQEQESHRNGKQIRAGLELKISRLQRMESLGLLAGGVAHDFNNLLVGVLGNAELLQMESESHDEFAEQRINQIIDAALKAADLSHQMLAYAGKRQIERKTVDLNQVLSRLSSVLESSFNGKMNLDISYSDLALVCEVDETQIEQVLMNLVSNAVAASEADATITIRTGQEQIDEVDESLHGTRTTGGQFNYVEVQDSGSGISESDVERIFEPFFSDKKTGRGLGLAVVYGTVSGHEGLIRLETEVGRGAKFRILLPDALNSDSKNSSPLSCVPFVDSPANAMQPTILVVDDEPSVLDFVQETLSVHGWNVLVASDGKQALKQIEDYKDQIRCLLLDVVMPEFGAAGVLSQLKEREITMPVVLMSGFSQTQLRDDFKSETQVVEIIEKPFRIESLVQALELATGVTTRVA